MAGVKGRSGRLGYYKDLDIRHLLLKSYSIMMAYFDDESIPSEKKAAFAAQFLSRRVGDKLDITVTHQVSEEQLSQLVQRANVYALPEADTSAVA